MKSKVVWVLGWWGALAWLVTYSYSSVRLVTGHHGFTTAGQGRRASASRAAWRPEGTRRGGTIGSSSDKPIRRVGMDMREEGDVHVERSRWKWKMSQSCCYLRVLRGVLVMVEHDCCKMPFAGGDAWLWYSL